MSNYRIQGATGEWEVVIGLEVHAQVTSNAKLFSGAATAFGAEPNSQVSLVDAAMPGMLPVPNRECIRQAVRTGLALDAVINRWSRFDRKNYFYADLPQGYQISQLYHPIVGEGEVEILLDELGKPRSLIRHVEDRLGHDRRYCLDVQKIMELGWEPDYTHEEAIRSTARWYVENRWWWEPIRNGDFKEYYQKVYGNRKVLERP